MDKILHVPVPGMFYMLNKDLSIYNCVKKEGYSYQAELVRGDIILYFSTTDDYISDQNVFCFITPEGKLAIILWFKGRALPFDVLFA